MAHTDYSALVARLDLPTKVTLLTGASAFTLSPCEAIGLTELRLSDGPTGVRGLKFSDGRTVALFPNATLLASAWDEDTAHEVGRLLAEEAVAQQIHVVLGPTINLHRSLQGGCSRPTARIRCSPAGWPPPTWVACRTVGSGRA